MNRHPCGPGTLPYTCGSALEGYRLPVNAGPTTAAEHVCFPHNVCAKLNRLVCVTTLTCGPCEPGFTHSSSEEQEEGNEECTEPRAQTLIFVLYVSYYIYIGPAVHRRCRRPEHETQEISCPGRTYRPARLVQDHRWLHGPRQCTPIPPLLLHLLFFHITHHLVSSLPSSPTCSPFLAALRVLPE